MEWCCWSWRDFSPVLCLYSVLAGKHFPPVAAPERQGVGPDDLWSAGAVDQKLTAAAASAVAAAVAAAEAERACAAAQAVVAAGQHSDFL